MKQGRGLEQRKWRGTSGRQGVGAQGQHLGTGGGGLGRSVLLLLGFPPFALKPPITFVAPVLFTDTSLVWRVLSNLRSHKIVK